MSSPTGTGAVFQWYCRNNFSFSRRSYSLHKHMPLVKPMVVVTTSGYTVSVRGLYLADCKNNDAGILNTHGRTVPNTQIPFIGDYVCIVSALCNRYSPPLSTGNTNDDLAMACKMRSLSLSPTKRIPSSCRDRGHGPEDLRMGKRVSVASDVVPDFPRIIEEEIRQITLGIYQVKKAKPNTAEHFQEDGNYEIHVSQGRT